MSVATVSGSYMPVDRWLAYTSIINDVRYGKEKEFSMAAVRREWGGVVRQYKAILKNGYAKQEAK